MGYVLSIAIFAALVLAAGGLRWSTRRKFTLATAHRAPLNDRNFALLFPGMEETAVAVRKTISAAVPGNGRLMRPPDRICEDLMADATDGLNTNEIVAVLERRFSISIPDTSASDVRTVQELVELVQALRDGNLTSQSIGSPYGVR